MFTTADQFVDAFRHRVQQRVAQITRVARQQFALDLSPAHAFDILSFSVERNSMRFGSLLARDEVDDTAVAAFIADARTRHPQMFETPTANDYVTALRERGVHDPSSYVRGRDDDEIRRAYFQLPPARCHNPSGSKAA